MQVNKTSLNVRNKTTNENYAQYLSKETPIRKKNCGDDDCSCIITMIRVAWRQRGRNSL